MNEAVTLGIDFGTSGVRIAAVTEAGHVAAFGSASTVLPQTSFSVRHLQDPLQWWKALEQAFAEMDLKNLHVKALAVDGTSGTILPVDTAGNPLGLASMYNDIAEPEDVENLNAVAPHDTAAHGNTSPLARALRMQNGAGRILHQADWLMGHLCGRFDLSDENNALKTGYDPVSRKWPSWISKTGLNTNLLPQVVPVGMRMGQISAKTAEAFHLPSDTTIVSGTTDGCAAFLASGANASGDAVTSLGTTLTVKLLSAKPVFAPQFGIYSHRIGDWWLAGGASNSGGGVLQKYFSSEELQQLTPKLRPSEPTGLNYYPLSQAGERFPIADAGLPPRLEPRPFDDIVFYQGILEGIADIEKLAFARLMELGASPITSIRTVGGGASNEPWTQIRLGKLGVPAKQALSDQAAVGAALLAWRGMQHAY